MVAVGAETEVGAPRGLGARLDALRARHGRRLAAVIFGLLALLLGQNTWCFFHNQHILPKEERFQLSPRDLEHVAHANKRYSVRTVIDVFYFLEHNIGGTRLTIPELMEKYEWELERVGRLDVDVSEDPLVISRGEARELNGKITGERVFELGTSPRRRWQAHLYLLRDPGASHYFVVRSRSDLFVVPEEVYSELERSEATP